MTEAINHPGKKSIADAEIAENHALTAKVQVLEKGEWREFLSTLAAPELLSGTQGQNLCFGFEERLKLLQIFTGMFNNDCQPFFVPGFPFCFFTVLQLLCCLLDPFQSY